MGKGGFFTNRLKYLKSKYNEKKPSNEAQELSMVELSLGPEEDLFFLKNCVVQNTDEKVIVAKLNSTRTLRREMMRVPEVDLRELQPYFLSAPQLV